MPAYLYILSYVEREDDPLVDTLAGDATADLIVLNSIMKVCGVEIDDDTVEFTSFLGSMDSVLLVYEINKKYPKHKAGLIKLADLLNSTTVKDLFILMNDKLEERRLLMRAHSGMFSTKDLDLGDLD